MSKTLILEIPDEVFSRFQRQAERQGESAEKFVLKMVLKNAQKTNGNLTEQEKKQALKELMKFSGAVSSKNSRSADNEQIDADLAEEYGKDL